MIFSLLVHSWQHILLLYVLVYWFTSITCTYHRYTDTLVHWTLYFMHTLITLDTIFHALIPLLRRCFITLTLLVMLMYHWYTDILFHWISWFHIFVSSLYEYSTHSYIMLHRVILYSYITVTWIHRYTHIDYLCIPVAWITVYISWIIATWIFMYSRYMIVSCYWYWYSRY